MPGEPRIIMSTETTKTKTMYANMEQFLLELMGDYLDSDCVKMDMLIAGVKDPLPVDQTDLHIDMAKAAMEVFRKTVVPI